jgi:AcrR family transcriptional regulator
VATAAKPKPARPTSATAKSTPKGERTRRAILEAALELFAETGYQGTGLMAIGERAGVTHAAVLYHFGTSEGLLMAVLDERLRRFDEATRDAFDGAPLDVLAALPEIARFNAANPELTKMFVVLKAESIDARQPAHDYFVRHIRRTHRKLAEVLRRGIELGQFRADLDAHAKAAEIVAFLGGAEADAFLDPARLDLVALYQSYTDALLRDLAAGRPGR